MMSPYRRMVKARIMKIGDLAKKSGLQTGTIRYYEKAGLIPEPERSNSNYRRYSESHIERLRFIQHCRLLDMSLEEIRLLLDYRDFPEANCSKVNDLIDEHIGHVTQRIDELRLLETQLRDLRSRCTEAAGINDCGILNALSCPAFSPEKVTAQADCVHIHHTHGHKRSPKVPDGE